MATFSNSHQKSNSFSYPCKTLVFTQGKSVTLWYHISSPICWQVHLMKINIKGGLELLTSDPRSQRLLLQDRSVPGKDDHSIYLSIREGGRQEYNEGGQMHCINPFTKCILAYISPATSAFPPSPPISLESKVICSSLLLSLTPGERKTLTEATNLVVFQSDMKLIMT